MRQFIFIRYCKTILLPAVITGLFIVSSCSDSPKSTHVYLQNNIIYSRATDEPFTGKIIDTVANRIIKYDVKNGLKDGEFIIYFLNGKKAMYGKVKENKNEGKWSYYYSNGKLESQGYFKNDKPTNKWTWYYLNGQKKEEGNFIDGQREGIWKMYKENGTLKSSVYFKEGKVISTFELKTFAS